MKQLTIKKKITLWYTGIIAVVLGTILVLVLLFVDKVGISATEEEISAAVTGFFSNINFQDDSYVDDPHTCRVESVIYEHATHFIFQESMLETIIETNRLSEVVF